MNEGEAVWDSEELLRVRVCIFLPLVDSIPIVWNSFSTYNLWNFLQLQSYKTCKYVYCVMKVFQVRVFCGKYKRRISGLWNEHGNEFSKLPPTSGVSELTGYERSLISPLGLQSKNCRGPREGTNEPRSFLHFGICVLWPTYFGGISLRLRDDISTLFHEIWHPPVVDFFRLNKVTCIIELYIYTFQHSTTRVLSVQYKVYYLLLDSMARKDHLITHTMHSHLITHPTH